MLTLDTLRAWGADVDDGMKRCMNNEAFYFRMITKAMQETGYDGLKQAIDSGDLTRGFEIAHALKGVTGNLALTPIDRPVREITELLREKAQTDYSPLVNEILARKQELTDMIG